MAKKLKWEIPLKTCSQKGCGCKKNTTLICVTRRVTPADLNNKQQFDSISFRLSDLKAIEPHQK